MEIPLKEILGAWRMVSYFPKKVMSIITNLGIGIDVYLDCGFLAFRTLNVLLGLALCTCYIGPLTSKDFVERINKPHTSYHYPVPDNSVKIRDKEYNVPIRHGLNSKPSLYGPK